MSRLGRIRVHSAYVGMVTITSDHLDKVSNRYVGVNLYPNPVGISFGNKSGTYKDRLVMGVPFTLQNVKEGLIPTLQ